MSRALAPAAHGVRWLGLVLGPLLAAAVWAWAPETLGPDETGAAAITPGGRATAAVAVWMACWWLTEALPLAATALLFALPVDPRERVFAMDWETAKRLPWGILILFGVGLSLAAAIAANGVDAWLASAFAHAAGAPPLVVVAAVATLVVFLTEVTSNTAVRPR